LSIKISYSSRWLVGMLPAFLVLTASAMAFFKIAYLGYTLDVIAPTESYFLETVMEFNGHGTGVAISMALPENLPNQTVSDEAFHSADLKFDIVMREGDRRGHWKRESVTGRRRVAYTATVVTKNLEFIIDSTLQTVQVIPDSVAKNLLPDSLSPSDHPEISGLADSLKLSANGNLLTNIKHMYQFASHGLKYVQYAGTTDALTAYRLREASCGGKSRLMVALARHIGIPARLVGGKILNQGQSRATHVWVELYVSGYWVPFCPTNDYFAKLPSNYLVLYHGDQPAITHTQDINFKYYFNLKKRLIQKTAGTISGADNPLDILNIWAAFERAAISIELLRIILMLPIGILVVVMFRNLIGVETFGTFMPALLAVGFRETGLLIGAVMFAAIILFGLLIRLVLSRLQLLHMPRLAIILTTVVLFILGMTIAGVKYNYLDVARVALFPIVILALTVERFFLITEEFGAKHALRLSVLTLFVASCSYGLMSWRLLQSIVLSFPEVLLVVIAVHIYIGRYSGFRIMEYFRFKELLVRA